MLNSVTLVGRLGADPELKYAQNGNAWLRVRIAVNAYDRGERTTHWFTVMLFGKTAELLANHASKGSMIGVTGRLVENRWEDKDGNLHNTVEINAFQLAFMDGQQKEQQEEQQSAHGSQNRGRQNARGNQKQNESYPPPPPMEEDDIPF